MSDPRWLLGEGGKPCGYDGRGTEYLHPCRRENVPAMAALVPADRLLRVWGVAAGGRLRDAAIGAQSGGAEGLDFEYLQWLHVERFWEDVGRRRRWAPLAVYGRGDYPVSIPGESWLITLARLGGLPAGLSVKRWDIRALAELLTESALADLKVWLTLYPIHEPTDFDDA